MTLEAIRLKAQANLAFHQARLLALKEDQSARERVASAIRKTGQKLNLAG